MLKAIKGTEHIAADSYSDGFALVLDCCRSFLQRGNPLGAIQGRATARLDRLTCPTFCSGRVSRSRHECRDGRHECPRHASPTAARHLTTSGQLALALFDVK
jgi:hypothetical protein